MDNIIGMDRDKVIKFIRDNTDNSNTNDMETALIDAILNIIPLLGHYEEEDRKFNFKIAIGIQTPIEDLTGRFHPLREYIDNKDDKPENKIKIIEKMIKDAAIFCEKDADIFIIQNKDIIQCGIYFTQVENTGLTEKSLLKKNFIIFQNLYKNKVLVLANDSTKLYICMDLACNTDIDKKYANNALNENNDICRTWKGIFERVKKTVHGTICLIVDTAWDHSIDENFTSNIKDLRIELSRPISPSLDKIHDFENKVSMLLSMLNYDGITIIDTNETIRAYNAFCKIEKEGQVVIGGGARHRAYYYLKSLPKLENSNYVALYFQSQEGEIEFFRYNNNKTEYYFDPTVMISEEKEKSEEKENNVKNKHIIELVDRNYKYINSEMLNLETDERKDYGEIDDKADDLLSAHRGIDNFYNEPSKARELTKVLEKYEKIEIILEKYSALRRKVINAVISCIIGNTYGYSRSAQIDLKEIVKIIPVNVWKKYFEKMEYLETDLLWDLSDERLYWRWRNLLNELKEKFEGLTDLIEKNIFSPNEFRIMYKECLKLEENK